MVYTVVMAYETCLRICMEFLGKLQVLFSYLKKKKKKYILCSCLKKYKNEQY